MQAFLDIRSKAQAQRNSKLKDSSPKTQNLGKFFRNFRRCLTKYNNFVAGKIVQKLKVKSPKPSNFEQIYYPPFAEKSSKKASRNDCRQINPKLWKKPAYDFCDGDQTVPRQNPYGRKAFRVRHLWQNVSKKGTLTWACEKHSPAEETSSMQEMLKIFCKAVQPYHAWNNM